MKSIKLYLFIAMVCMTTGVFTAQVSLETKKIGFYADVVTDEKSGSYVKNRLQAILNSVLLQNSLGDMDSNHFVVLAKIVLVDESVSSTIPPINKVIFDIQFIVADNFLKKKYGIYSVNNCIGINANREKAIVQGLNKIRMDKRFVKFLEKKKEEIIEFYSIHCTDLITQASVLADGGKYEEAIKILKTIPKVNQDCFNMSQEKLKKIYMSESLNKLYGEKDANLKSEIKSSKVVTDTISKKEKSTEEEGSEKTKSKDIDFDTENDSYEWMIEEEN